MRINDKYNVDDLAARVERARRGTPPAPVSFDAFEIHGVESVLETCVDFQPAIPDPDRPEIIRAAIHGAAAEGVVTREALVRHLQQGEIAYLRRPLRDYVIASSVTIPATQRVKALRLEDASITFTPALPARFSRRAITQEVDSVTKIGRPWSLLQTRARVKARTHKAAYHVGMNALDYIRGIWNIHLNSGIALRFRVGPPEPLNAVRLGPVHTLHKASGALETESFWYESFDRQTDRVHTARDWQAVEKFVKAVRSQHAKIRYGAELDQLVIRYCRALDNPDHEVAYSKLFGVFERLFDAVGEYKLLAPRIAAMFSAADREFIRSEVEHLRDVRNDLVHMDRSREGMETYLFQMKYLVERGFRFHWGRGRRYNSIKAACGFLDYPVDPALLRDRIAEYREALKYHGG